MNWGSFNMTKEPFNVEYVLCSDWTQVRVMISLLMKICQLLLRN